ncbi:unnamed protein product [Sphagnum troendelagicum]|uniref:Aspartyl aminopeptidase n=1 Tax=Sphagnum troendelagicum TaxID=128251 RepID=A0ABP0U9L4_9BRYO
MLLHKAVSFPQCKTYADSGRCQARHGDAECVNCPQKHTKKAKRPRDVLPLASRSPGISLPAAASLLVTGGAADGDYADGASIEGRGGGPGGIDNTHLDDNTLTTAAVAGENHVRLVLPMNATSVSNIHFLAANAPLMPPPPHQQQAPPSRPFFSEKGHIRHESPASIVPSLLEFVNNSHTPFHATVEATRHLLSASFQQLSECGEWALHPGGCYFFTHNMSSVFAFAVGSKYVPGGGFHVVAAHTDSPCPKLKPVAHGSKEGDMSVQVHMYGTGMWQTWFDRDLSIAGRVLMRRKGHELTHELVRVRHPMLHTPTLPIRGDSWKSDLEAQLAPLLAIQIEAELTISCESESSLPVEKHGIHVYPANGSSHHPLLLQVLAEELECDVNEIADFDLGVYDTQPGTLGGVRNDFVFAGRLDNLASAYCALSALLDTCAEPSSLMDETSIYMVALFNSGKLVADSSQGAGPQAMLQTMTHVAQWSARDSDSEANVDQAMRRSFIVSADMVHGLHPSQVNTSGANEEVLLQPKLHHGLVMRHDTVHNHAADIVTSYLFREIAKWNCIPTQNYAVVRDLGCCLTINAIIAAGYGIRVVDCGLPQLSMHCVQEMCCADDLDAAFRHFRAFFEHFTAIDEHLRVD